MKIIYEKTLNGKPSVIQKEGMNANSLMYDLILNQIKKDCFYDEEINKVLLEAMQSHTPIEKKNVSTNFPTSEVNLDMDNKEQITLVEIKLINSIYNLHIKATPYNEDGVFKKRYTYGK